jgi:hypothetical protein
LLLYRPHRIQHRVDFGKRLAGALQFGEHAADIGQCQAALFGKVGENGSDVTDRRFRGLVSVVIGFPSESL